jgi:hypothetical protein
MRLLSIPTDEQIPDRIRMNNALHFCFAAGFLFFTALGRQAQSDNDTAKSQEDFAVTVATAHARTSLVTVGSKPFAIHAKVISALALHGTGTGTYENQWADGQHWRRVIRFPDFEQTEMRNDSGHSWTDQSNDEMPIRIAQMLRVVMVHLPTSTTASSIPVTETPVAGEHGEALTCYASTPPTPADNFPRQFRWCFDKASGLLVSQDLPVHTRVVYSNYIEFQGKHEFTHVRVTSGSFTTLDIELQYEPLDPHALDGNTPYSTMHRTKSAGSTANPEELGKGSVEYSANPLLPPGTPDADKNQPVQVQIHVSADNAVLDASVEDAPTEEMGKAAVQAAQKFTFTPLTVDGNPVANHFYYSIWFRSSADDASSPSDAEKQPEHADNVQSPSVTSGPQSRGHYRNEELSFTFGYPIGFVPIPQAELEEEQRTSKRPYAACNTFLFRAQRLHPGQTIPEVVSIIDLHSSCIFDMIDHKALETIALSTAHSVVVQWAHGSVSKPKLYSVSGHTFAIVSVSDFGSTTSGPVVSALVIVTKIHNDVVGWTILGSDGNLAQTLKACTLQIGQESESPLLPPSEKP